MEKARQSSRIPPAAARKIRQPNVLTGQARQDLIEETVKHVLKFVTTSDPMEAARALSRGAILEGTRAPREEEEE